MQLSRFLLLAVVIKLSSALPIPIDLDKRDAAVVTETLPTVEVMVSGTATYTFTLGDEATPAPTEATSAAAAPAGQVAVTTNIVTQTTVECPETETPTAAASSEAANLDDSADASSADASSDPSDPYPSLVVADPDSTATPDDGLVHIVNVISRPGALFRATAVNVPLSTESTLETSAQAGSETSSDASPATSSEADPATSSESSAANAATTPSTPANAATTATPAAPSTPQDSTSASQPAVIQENTSGNYVPTTTNGATTSDPAASDPTSSDPTSSDPTSSDSTSSDPTSSDPAVSDSSSTDLPSSSTIVSSPSSSSQASSSYLTVSPGTIVYSPYTDSDGCKTYDTVLSDLTLIKSKGITKLRIYGNDCNYLTAVLPISAQLGLSVNQGFWISDEGVDSIDSAVTDLINAVTSGTAGFGWDIFSFFTIGNEAIISGYCSVSDLIAKISSVKAQLRSAGYTGQVTTSEPPVSFESNPSLCTGSEIDFVGINPHAYFDIYASAETAGTFVQGQIGIVQGVCPGMNVFVTETGYPSAGITNGGNVPSPANQLIAVQNIFDVVGTDVTILTTFEDYWKQPGPYGIEQSFGIIQLLN